MEQSNSLGSFKSLSPDIMLDAIESEGLACNGRFLALNSYENRVFQVGLEEDGKETLMVAKFYRPQRWDDEAIIEEHHFTLQLEAAEIPVISPIVNQQGKSLHHFGDYRFALYPNRGGRALELDNAEHLEQLGRFIGRIHAVGSKTDFSHRPTLDIDSFAIKPRAYLLEHNFIPDYLLPAYESLSADLINQVEQKFAAAGDVQLIRLHGDFHPSNILYRDDTPHIVDFDDARTGPAVQDLWMFLSGDRQYMNQRLGDLLTGYEQFYEFNPRELHLIEALRTIRIIHYAAWLASRWNDSAFPLAFPWFNTNNYWESHILALREQAAALNEPSLIW
ncbi:MAG: serine/threonine protein kinase [Gammaproteobacteria bacterium]|nr:serine/threonine protein kinase [Gammaproteobacteria bacterium]